MEEHQATSSRHVCGVCGGEWLTEAEYLAHVCPGTGKQPTDPEHLGPEFAAVQEAALARGSVISAPIAAISGPDAHYTVL